MSEPDFTPPLGLTKMQTATYVAGFIEDSAQRMLRLGEDKGGYQAFEGQTPEEDMDKICEDLQDLAAHAALLYMKVRRMKKALASEREVTA